MLNKLHNTFVFSPKETFPEILPLNVSFWVKLVNLYGHQNAIAKMQNPQEFLKWGKVTSDVQEKQVNVPLCHTAFTTFTTFATYTPHLLHSPALLKRE